MITIEKYGRYWAVYCQRQLLCVTVYKRGAEAVRALLTTPNSREEANAAA